MFSWLKQDESRRRHYDSVTSVVEGLKSIYKDKILPLETYYHFNDFHSPKLADADFDAKPMVLLVGQYSTGKTTFIRYLLERDFPGIRIGPEPTTDRFIAVMHSDVESVIPGPALVVDQQKQFKPLAKFGSAFLNKLQCSLLPSPVLQSLSIIDTPGILSGEKQRTDRGYEFTGVLEWFAERVDRIILLFDAHKLDISDEFRRSIEALRGHDDKIRIVLNKADMVNHQQLMRVYGALMWSLGKVLGTPEVARVYIGSFWDEPLRYDTNRSLFEAEEQDLFSDIQALPRNAALRKLNDLIKRARLAKVHAYIVNALRTEYNRPLFGKESKKRELIKNLGKVFALIQKEQQISAGDFPDVREMQEKLSVFDWSRFKPFNKKLLDDVDAMLNREISKLMKMVPEEQAAAAQNGFVEGGHFESKKSIFGFGRGEGADYGSLQTTWVIERDLPQYEKLFYELEPHDGKISGAAAKEEMMKSMLPNSVLGKIWKLADVDKDGMLDLEEFALAMHLIQVKLNGHDLPTGLPEHLLPPSHRNVPCEV